MTRYRETAEDLEMSAPADPFDGYYDDFDDIEGLDFPDVQPVASPGDLVQFIDYDGTHTCLVLAVSGHYWTFGYKVMVPDGTVDHVPSARCLLLSQLKVESTSTSLSVALANSTECAKD